ncbi:MAG: transglycosylase domain-containing protein [Mogibacterium sp.]|nr:transglycosylase domain-containing protein [Mogibacterium sp.]
MRSDRDKRTESEKDIDDFLSQFDTPADDLSADYSEYLDEPEAPSADPVNSGSKGSSGFSWKSVGTSDLEKAKSEVPALADAGSEAMIAHEAETVSEAKTAADAVQMPEPVDFDYDKDDSIAYHKVDRGSHRRRSARKTIVAGPSIKKAIEEAASAADTEDLSDKAAEKAAADKVSAEETASVAIAAESSAELAAGAALAEAVAKNSEKTKDKKASKNAAKRAKQQKRKKKAKTPAGYRIKKALFCKDNPNYDPEQGKTYVKDGKTIKNKKLKFSFFKLFRDFVFLGLIFVMAGLTYALVTITMAPKFDYTDVYSAVDTASIVYDDKEKQIDNVFYTENRKIIKYEEMPEELVESFIAIEDKTFWKHHGFNWTRMIGAVLSSLTGNGRISGTSTITQQLARNVYLADTKSVRSIKRKVLEMYYASRLEHYLNKEQIVEAYLNTIYLGHGCYGVNAAARTYFSKNVQDLDLVESAALAALPQSPDTYALLKLASEAQDVVDSKVVQTEPETVVTNDLARGRRQLALDLMLDQGLITQAEHDEVYDEPLNDFIDPSLKSNSTEFSYFHDYLVETIINDLMDQYDMEYEDAERMVYTKGLQIYSTVNSKAQKTIAREFQDGSNFPYVSAPRDWDGNLLNNDGQIALYNYDNDFDSEGNFKLSGADGDVKVNDDGSFTIMAGHKMPIYETEVDSGIEYSIEFRDYYIYDDNDILYSINGGYLNIPADYKTADENGNVTISADYFSDPTYEGAIKISGDDVILTEKSYTLSSRSRQPQAAMTIVGVGTGEVKAMVGGRQFGGQKLLNRSLNPRQPGSSIKPLAVYGAALQKSYELAEKGEKWKFTNFKIDRQGTKGWGDYITVHSSVEDEKTKIEGKYWPNNFNNSFSGANTFKTAIQKSINTCAVKILLQVGADYSINQLKKFGLTTVQDDTSQAVNDENPAALALGAMTNGVEPLEMALAYSAFPAGGKVNTPICYTKVLDREGNTILTGESKQSEAMNEGVAWIMTDVLKSVVSYNNYMYVEDVSPGGKTGTTNDQYDIWFDGFTPSYAASLWIGTDENIEMSSMSTPAAALWGKIINQLPEAKKGSYAKQPGNVISKWGEYYTSGTETGLTSWSDKEARKKARDAAYKKWQAQRANHRHKVVDEKGHYENKLVTPEQYNEYDTEETEMVEVGEDEEGNPIYEEQTHTVHHKEKIADAVYKKVWVEEKWHWEYDKGWRDGDFKYDGD